MIKSSCTFIWYPRVFYNEKQKQTNKKKQQEKKCRKKYMKAKELLFLSTHPTDPWCNMLQTLQRRRKYISIILSNERTPIEWIINFCLKLMNHDISNVRWPHTYSLGKIYWERININTINWDKLFNRSTNNK